MNDKIAYCGMVCNTCLIYLATREQDTKKQRQMRAEIALKINEIYNEKMRAEDVTDCDGCRSNERLFSGCKQCHIRNCAGSKGIDNCAYCSEYTCEKIEKFFATESDAKARLDAIRRGLHK